MFSLPAWKLGLTTDYHYSSAEQADREYIKQTLNPLLTQAEREINSKWFSDVERDTHYIEFNRDKLVQLDAKTQAEIEDLGIKNGTLKPNEKRAIHNQPSDVGGNGLLFPVNYQTAAYTEASEALKLEALRLDVEAKQKALTTPAPALTLDQSNRSLEAAKDAIQASQTQSQGEIDLLALQTVQSATLPGIAADTEGTIGKAARAIEAHYGLQGEPLKPFETGLYHLCQAAGNSGQRSL
jgi:hypothetical protein